MNPLQAYRNQSSPGWSRIDMLLAQYDTAIARIEEALAALERDDRLAALPLLVKAQLIVVQLASGLNPEYSQAESFRRLFEYAAHSLSEASSEKVRGVHRVLCTLREGFRDIREEALSLERSGAIPPASALHIMHTSA